MLKPIPFANALAISTLAFSLLLWIISLAAPVLFRMIYNAQFMGANVASLYGETLDATLVFPSIVILVASAWVLGFVWATVYNYLLKQKK